MLLLPSPCYIDLFYEQVLLRRYQHRNSIESLAKALKSTKAKYGTLDPDLPALILRHHKEPATVLTYAKLAKRNWGDMKDLTGIQVGTSAALDLQTLDRKE